METADTKNPLKQSSESDILTKDAGWLTANIEVVNRSYYQILELIESGAMRDADNYDDAQCVLVAHIEKILEKHQALAEQYVTLRTCNNDSSSFHQQNIGDGMIEVSNEYFFRTPDRKSSTDCVKEEAPSIVSSQMACGGNYNTSAKEGSEYSVVYPDSDSELYEKSVYKSAKSHIDVQRIFEYHFVDKEEDGGTKEGQLETMIKYEGELDLPGKKLQLSDREVSNLLKELDSTRNEFKIEKKKVEVLQNRISILDYQIANFNAKTGSLEMELDLAKQKLESTEEEITKLKNCPANENSDDSIELKKQLELAREQVAMLDAKLDGERRQASEMQNKIQQYVSDGANHDYWIQKLQGVVQQVTDKSRQDEMHFQSQISSLAEHLMLTEASNGGLKDHCESLKKQLQQCEEDMAYMQMLHEVEEIRWKNDIDIIKTELSEKVESMEILNYDLDTLKLKYDMLEAEKVSWNCKLQALNEGLCAKDDHIRALEDLLHQLRLENDQIISASDSVCNQLEDLKLNLKHSEEEAQSLKLDLMHLEKEVQMLHEVEEIRWKNDIDIIKTELSEKVESMKILNYDLDTLKLKYDMLVAEKVSCNCKLQALNEGLCAKDDHIRALEDLLHQLRLENDQIISASDSVCNQLEDLKLNLKHSEEEGQSLKLDLMHLEKEVQSQRVLVLDRAEEKREAIRQLCVTLEYYKNRYEELLQVCKGFKPSPRRWFLDLLR